MGHEILHYNVLVIGDHDVGKTCLAKRFADAPFTEPNERTIGVDIHNITFDDCHRLRIWSTSPSTPKDELIIQGGYLSRSAAVVLVYDITNRRSFENVKNVWHKFITNSKHNTAIIIIGNKSDVSDDKRTVTKNEGANLAIELNATFHETSAKVGTLKVDDIFGLAIKSYVDDTKTIRNLRLICKKYHAHLVKNLKSEKKDHQDPILADKVENIKKIFAILKKPRYPAQLNDFKEEFEKNRTIFEKSRDSHTIVFLKAIATILTLGTAVWFGLWHVKGKQVTEQIDRSLRPRMQA